MVANVGSAVDGSSHDSSSNGSVSGTGDNDGFVASGGASTGGGTGSDINASRHEGGVGIVISDSDNAIVDVEDATPTENDEQVAVSPVLHEPMDEGRDDDVPEETRTGLNSDHEG